MGRIYNDIVETVGRTPLVRLNRVTAGLPATILLKCEFFNPLAASRSYRHVMIEAAEKSGLSRRTPVIIEPTSAYGHRPERFVPGQGIPTILHHAETMSLERGPWLRCWAAN